MYRDIRDNEIAAALRVLLKSGIDAVCGYYRVNLQTFAESIYSIEQNEHKMTYQKYWTINNLNDVLRGEVPFKLKHLVGILRAIKEWDQDVDSSIFETTIKNILGEIAKEVMQLAFSFVFIFL